MGNIVDGITHHLWLENYFFLKSNYEKLLKILINLQAISLVSPSKKLSNQDIQQNQAIITNMKFDKYTDFLLLLIEVITLSADRY